MEPLKIRVSGESSTIRLAEQGTLRLTVESEGSQLEVVSKEVIARSNELSELFKALSPKAPDGTATADAAVTKVASTFLRTRNYTPRNRDNQQLPKVYQASMSLSVVFRDMTKLSEVIGQLVGYSNVEIIAIDWSLTDATKKSLGSQVRREAIRDAVRKAKDYAEELGREIYAVDVMDGGQNAVAYHAPVGGGLFGSNTFGKGRQTGGSLFGCASASGPSNPAPEPSPTLDLSPQDIQLTSSVSVEFQSVPGEERKQS
ncbi:hypothetical protein N7532_008005 [Penicillium argentinense]|uniref:SIMPL domain-containing protein n=1 Tax=Penicillium argentinense TaxID=1131581 RepID=A0A9W9EWU8_9EURO|nr:uncharacterized protein N7532_008005 [Penicillium argentinense]KAJ5089321.1 hypothetical protein N7532_008005 [Penicillium argentinense]